MNFFVADNNNSIPGCFDPKNGGWMMLVV